MKKYITLSLSTIILVFGQNLLQNPGFETWTGGMPNYWFKDDSILVVQEDVVVHSGVFSVKDSLITQTQTRADFFQGSLVVQPNMYYDFTIWVYDNDLAGRLRPGITWYIGTDSISVYSTTYSSNSTAWQGLVFTGLSPDGTDSATVFMRAYDSSATWDGGAVFYLDDVIFEPSPVQPPVIIRVWHIPINPNTGTTENVYARVSDDGTIIADTLYYGVNSLSSPLKLSHTTVSNDTFRYQIPGQIAGDTVFYYLKFIDDDALSAISDTLSYYVGTKNLFINEVYYDAPGSDSGCFIELYGSASASLNGIILVGVNGNDGLEYTTIDLGGYSIPADGFFVVAQNSWVVNADTVTAEADLQNGPDNLELRFNNITIDALGYGTLDGWVFTGEWIPAIDVTSGHCLGRYPDGDDTDNNYVDFYDFATLTPGTPNPSGITESKVLPKMDFKIKNPVVSGISFATLVKEENLYPIYIYNSLGQLVKTVCSPLSELILPGGVYFLKLHAVDSQSIKIVVVK